MPKLIALILVSLTVLVGATACGDEEPAPGVEAYNTYRELEDARNDAESQLRQAISDINDAAVAEDREAVLAAADDGLAAVKAIDKALEAEIEAARELGEISKIAGDAKDLENGLADTRESLTYFEQMLNIAMEDPFLEKDGNQEKVGNLARRGHQPGRAGRARGARGGSQDRPRPRPRAAQRRGARQPARADHLDADDHGLVDVDPGPVAGLEERHGRVDAVAVRIERRRAEDALVELGLEHLRGDVGPRPVRTADRVDQDLQRRDGVRRVQRRAPRRTSRRSPPRTPSPDP